MKAQSTSILTVPTLRQPLRRERHFVSDPSLWLLALAQGASPGRGRDTARSPESPEGKDAPPCLGLLAAAVVSGRRFGWIWWGRLGCRLAAIGWVTVRITESLYAGHGDTLAFLTFRDGIGSGARGVAASTVVARAHQVNAVALASCAVSAVVSGLGILKNAVQPLLCAVSLLQRAI